MSETPPPTSLAALQQVVDQIETSAAALGWDRPPTLYALVPTSTLLQQEDLPDDIRDALRAEWDQTETHLSAVAQETLSEEALEEALPRIEWPEQVQGAALTLERIVLPGVAQDAAPEDPDEALAYAQNHPDQTDVRVAVGVDRDGNSWCEVRTRSFDDRASVSQGPDLVPGLVEALRLGLTS